MEETFLNLNEKENNDQQETSVRVLSVDIGWRHLAFCECLVNKATVQISRWEIVDVIVDEDINVNTSTLEVLIEKSSKHFGNLVSKWAEWNPTIAFLESQPLGQMARNMKTKTLSHILQALLLARGIQVKFVSPKKKLLGMEGEGGYSENKKYSVEATCRILQKLELDVWYNWFHQKKGKRDDLADAFLQGYYAGKHFLFEKDKAHKKRNSKANIGDKDKPKTKKAKRNAHAETEDIVKSELDIDRDVCEELLKEN